MNMAKIYYNLIIAGRRTIESVPEQDRADVQALLDQETQALQAEET
jgi:hypothetical protein